MSVWRVPLLERFTCIKGEGMRHGATKYPGQYVEVDGVGLYVECPDPDYITADRVRHHLIGLRSTFCIIEADSEVEVRRIFAEEWDGAKVGTRAKALRIVRMSINKKRISLSTPRISRLMRRQELKDCVRFCGRMEVWSTTKMEANSFPIPTLWCLTRYLFIGEKR